MNRLSMQSHGGEDPLRLTATFMISTEWNSWIVSTQMARFVEACIEHTPTPVWVKFVDVKGRRVRLRVRQIESITQGREPDEGWCD